MPRPWVRRCARESSGGHHDGRTGRNATKPEYPSFPRRARLCCRRSRDPDGPRATLAKPGDPPNPSRILGQIAGPNGEIIDAKTGNVVVPAPGSSVPGDNGLGEGEDRLELAENPPSVCLACGGCEQRIGFGSRTEPCDECGGAGTTQLADSETLTRMHWQVQQVASSRRVAEPNDCAPF